MTSEPQDYQSPDTRQPACHREDEATREAELMKRYGLAAAGEGAHLETA
jgi:hypothetical protein